MDLKTLAVMAPLVLVCTATEGFRHESIETAEDTLAAMAARTGLFQVRFARTEAEMVAALSPDALRDVRVVMFVNTTGEVATPRRAGLLQWVADGGAFIGVHSASDTWHESDQYLDMLGGEFVTHPDETTVAVHIDDPAHLSTAGLASPYTIFEEIYLFGRFSRERVNMLMSLRAHPQTRAPGFFPLAWHKGHGGGRVLYTALGHRKETWGTPWFQQHLTGAIEWGLGRERRARRRAVGR